MHTESALGAEHRLERWAHWPRTTDSPYYGMFYGAMRAHGVVPVATLRPTEAWLESREADAVHVHWPERLWRREGRGPLARFRRVRRLTRFLVAARAHGLRVIWTIDNVRPHEGFDWVDRRGYAVVARAADVIICHTRSSLELVSRSFAPRGEILVMPHGSFEGVVSMPRPRDVVLRDLGLDPLLPTVCCVGYLRAYKGLELACTAVSTFAGRVQLIVAGPAHGYDMAAVRRAMGALPGAVLADRRLTDQEFADVVGNSDASLLPYSSVTTSGVMLASWTLGTGVIASDLPAFREMIPLTGDAARLFRAGDAGSLAGAIEAYLSVPLARRRRAAADEAAKVPLGRVRVARCSLALAQSPA